MKTMKTLLAISALVLTISLSGNATNVASGVKNQTENMMVSKTDSSSANQSGKSKKAHGKKHTHASGTKKTK